MGGVVVVALLPESNFQRILDSARAGMTVGRVLQIRHSRENGNPVLSFWIPGSRFARPRMTSVVGGKGRFD